MNAPYARTALRRLHTRPDGSYVFVPGRYQLHLDHMLLTDGHADVVLVGTPFDWLPPHDAAIEVWGQLWHGDRLRLGVHDARPLGSSARRPVPPHPRPLGFHGTLIVRVTTLGPRCVAVTAHQHAYLLDQLIVPDGLYRLTGTVTALSPPALTVQDCEPYLPPETTCSDCS